jgi:predicted secreted hydrolase
MNARSLLALVFIWIAPVAHAQGFAGLGLSAEGYAAVDPNRPITFPQDHTAHTDYRIEWWYLTANLTDAAGNPLGAQWTVFRNATRPADGQSNAWEDGQIWLGHAAVTLPDHHYHSERYARGGTGQAGALLTENLLEVWIDDWGLQSLNTASETDALDQIIVSARGDTFAYDLTLTAHGPLVRHGVNGFSVKSNEGQASYYYSQPFYEVSGTITLPDGARQVSGQAWLDREWSSQPLAADQAGWDWVSLHFETGEKLMGFSLRSRDETRFTSATWISANGQPTAYGDGALRMTPIVTHEVAGRVLPVGWHITLPEQGLDIRTNALNPDAWMGGTIPYWEGPIFSTGSHLGRGYLEMTGY